ncbi:Gfo/Idh/MocA family protein [Frondihabitans australicus]|uniref:Putative dehydrogenase n=1 Tax=Frondihabitans australicus TaxID=386892 RepID=A0A495IH17_9MICO|nr:Gfo/Idh/MocA family oxidoreductase [Frondihabitans australicus]RKR74366.1 putative dehydrogenase [Frondihabitans australicus]
MRIAIVGYGSGGRYFHAPFIEAADGVELVAVVARSAEKQALVAQDLGVPTYDSLTSLLAAGLLRPGIDAVTITTPPHTRRDLVLEAIAAGLHVVADKPFAPTAADGQELVDAAAAAGVTLSVFHNRRFDADIRTLAGVVAGGRLGELWRVHSRFDLDEPDALEAGESGGLLRDLGSHLVDQMLWLLGDVESVSAALDWVDLPEGRTDAGFVIALRHASGVVSYVESSKINHIASRTLRAYGAEGSYVADGTDVQARAILAGERPADDRAGWGYEDESRWGTLATAAGAEAVPSAQGAAFEFYEQFARAVAGRGEAPSPGPEGVRALAVLDAARASAASGAWTPVARP